MYTRTKPIKNLSKPVTNKKCALPCHLPFTRPLYSSLINQKWHTRRKKYQNSIQVMTLAFRALVISNKKTKSCSKIKVCDSNFLLFSIEHCYHLTLLRYFLFQSGRVEVQSKHFKFRTEFCTDRNMHAFHTICSFTEKVWNFKVHIQLS